MDISVIIPSYNGAKKLPALLDSILAQSQLPAEIIVALDGSTDGSRELIDHIDSPLIKLIEQANGGRASIRNFGASKAKCPGMVFIDDDMVLQPGAMEALGRHLSTVGDRCFIVGLCRLMPENNTELMEQWRLHTEYSANNRLSDFEKIGLDNYRFTSGLLYVDQYTFGQLGGFDERLNDSEDFDLSMRALGQDHSIYFAKEFASLHRDNRSIPEYIERKVEYWRSKSQLAQLYPQYRLLAPRQFVAPQSKGSRILLYPFRYSALWSAFFQSKIMRAILPRPLLFKLLDRVVYSTAMLRYSDE